MNKHSKSFGEALQKLGEQLSNCGFIVLKSKGDELKSIGDKIKNQIPLNEQEVKSVDDFMAENSKDKERAEVMFKAEVAMAKANYRQN